MGYGADSLPLGVEMKPYYEEAGITIYHGDCRDILPELTRVDAVIADPPYNARLVYGESVNDNRTWEEYIEWLKPIIEICESLSDGPVFVFLSVNGLLEITRVKRPRHIAVWDKPMSFSPRLGGSAFLPHWEPCAIFGKVWGEGGKVPDWHISDVWHHNPSLRNGHPCPKPYPLLMQIIGAMPAKKILDPFMGSGTTLVAAKNLGREASGIEIEERYCEIAANRLRQSVFNFEERMPNKPVQPVCLFADEEMEAIA